MARRIQIASNLTDRARRYLDAWWFLVHEESLPHIRGVIFDFAEFFRLQTHTNRFCCVTETAGLFKDKASNTVSLPALCRETKQPLQLIGAFENVTRLLDESSPIAKRVEKLRSEAFAHRSGSVDFDEAFEKAQLSLDCFKILTDNALVISNALCRSHGLSEMSFRTDMYTREARQLFGRLGASFPKPKYGSVLDEVFDGN